MSLKGKLLVWVVWWGRGDYLSFIFLSIKLGGKFGVCACLGWVVYR